MGLASYFDAIVVASEVGGWKPDPRVYRRALEVMGASIEDCVYLDDSPADASGAADLGIKTYLMDRQDQFAAHPLPRVASLREFAQTIGVGV
jgi:FMN phosphatase YigB (HAD superfamily)